MLDYCTHCVIEPSEVDGLEMVSRVAVAFPGKDSRQQSVIIGVYVSVDLGISRACLIVGAHVRFGNEWNILCLMNPSRSGAFFNQPTLIAIRYTYQRYKQK